MFTTNIKLNCGADACNDCGMLGVHRSIRSCRLFNIVLFTKDGVSLRTKYCLDIFLIQEENHISKQR